MASTIITVSTVASNPQLAEAKYADYARREKDWDERKSTKGGVQYSNAKDLRRQLAEMVPANDEGSKIFCPNGASAAMQKFGPIRGSRSAHFEHPELTRMLD